MCPEPSSVKNTESQILRREDGESMDLSKLSKRQGDTSVTSSKTSLMSDQKQKTRKERTNEERSAIVESAPRNKKTTLKDKKSLSGRATRTTKSSKTSGQGSTLNEEDFCEWLTPYCKETSKKLLSLIKTDCVGSPLISSNGYVNEETQISWSKSRSYVPQNKSLQKISLPSFTSFLVNSTGQGDTRKETSPKPKVQMRSRKVRIKPTKEQTKVLRFWMSTYRKTYNEALRLVKDKKAKANLALKKLVVTRRDSDEGTKWGAIKKSPADVRVSAVRSLCNNFTSAKAAYRERLKRIKSGKVKNKRNRKKNSSFRRNRFRNNKPFEIKYKARRLTSDSFELEAKSIRMDQKNLTLFGSEPKYSLNLDVSEVLSENNIQPNHSCKICYFFGRWYFVIPEVLDPEKEPMDTESEPRVVGIDPGLRKAFTCVSNQGRIDEIGIQTRIVAEQLNKKSCGILKAIKESQSNLKKKKLTRAWYRVNARAKDLVTDFHFKTIKFLTDHYDVIIMGKINVQQLMSMKSQSRSNKEMFKFLSHFLFRQRLLMKTSNMTSKTVIVQDESYTTQTCVKCGVLKKDVGGCSVYDCSRCNFKIGRDISGASNILLRCVSEIHQKTNLISGNKRKIN